MSRPPTPACGGMTVSCRTLGERCPVLGLGRDGDDDRGDRDDHHEYVEQQADGPAEAQCHVVLPADE